MNSIDLQIQSSASDGKHSPRELVRMSQEHGLSVISITDHDTVGGVDEAFRSSLEYGVRVIPGIEMSVEDRGVHILGYGIDHRNSELLSQLEIFQQHRIQGAKQMTGNLKNAGFMIEWEDVLKEAKGTIARPHIARALLSHTENNAKLEGAKSVHDVIERYLTEKGPYYVARAHILAKDAIDLLHRASGVAIWSHPALHFREDYGGLEKFWQKLIGWGIDGAEVFNPSHTEDDVEFIEGLIVKYGLLKTAGSDFHALGENARDTDGLRSAAEVGDYNTYGFSTEGIVEKLDRAIKKYSLT